MAINESKEDYLECILMLKKEKSIVRSIDIAHEMGYSKPSISIAMKNLKEDGFITVDLNGSINLTKTGEELANKIYERHQIISALLIDLGVSKEQALIDACKMEHDLSEETFNAIKKYYHKK